MNALKYTLSYLMIYICQGGSALLVGSAGINYAFLNYKWFDKKMTILFSVLGIALFFLQYLFIHLRNKYRDILEYDDNNISREYGNFSNLSDQEREEIEKQKLLKRELLIDTPTLKNITKKGASDPEKELQEMIGLEELKKEIHKMEAKLRFQKEVEKKSKRHKKKKSPDDAESSYHMVFTGRAGTGKTQCCRIMSGFLYKYGIIRKNQYIEIDGNFFNGSSYGESTEKVKFIIGQAKGGVLFIDEAYAMLNTAESQEVIATLIAAMENLRNDLVVIMAGYDNEMRALINSNTGFQSRVKYYFHFKDYNIDELWLIFLKMAKEKGYQVEDDVKDHFVSYILEEMKKINYGNARTVRTILDKAIDNHAVNYVDHVLDTDQTMTIIKEDLPVDEKIIIKTVNANDI